jgi:hypothetical protein
LLPGAITTTETENTLGGQTHVPDAAVNKACPTVSVLETELINCFDIESILTP